MSYIYNNEIKYSDSPNLDAFGRLRTSQITTLLELKHIYNKIPFLVNEKTGGTATSVFQQEYARVRMSTSTNNDFVVRQSKKYPIYQNGKGQLFEASFGNFENETNVIKRVGLFTSTTASTYNSVFDGFFLESNGVTNEYVFYIYRSGTTIFSADSTTWLDSEFNPASIDWSKTQLMFVDYQWLGVGRMRFGMVFDGKVVFFTEHNSTNSETEVYMSIPSLPIRYEIRQVGVGSGYFDMICSQVASEGSQNNLYTTTSVIHSATTTLTTSGVKYPYIGVRLKNSEPAIFGNIIGGTVLNTSNDNYVLTVEYNPTISSTPTWVDLPNSPFQYSLQDGSNTINNSGLISISLIGEAGTTATSQIPIIDNVVGFGVNVDGTSDEVWVCVQPLGANATFISNINLQYYQ